MNSLRKAEKFVWTDDMDVDFKELRLEFQIGRVQGYPDFHSDKPFRLTTDWSSKNIAGILSQVQEGEDRFLGGLGRKCSSYEQNYPSYKGELLAVVCCAKKWRHLLSYRPFEIYTDASALLHLSTMKNQTGIFMRWYETLGGLQFKVFHKKVKENMNTDTLSRSTHLLTPTEEEIEEFK